MSREDGTRRFSGRTFHLFDYNLTKRLANSAVAGLKKNGFLVRLTGKTPNVHIWINKEKRTAAQKAHDESVMRGLGFK